jgi:CRISPR system Cascade subunit CasA
VTGLDQATSDGEWHRQRLLHLDKHEFDANAVNTYLNLHPDGWDLFHPRWPWWQDARLADQSELKTANVLDLRRPDDNKPIWWRHTHHGHAPDLSLTDALELLLIQHFYGSGGTGGTREVGDQRNQHMSAGPLRSTVTFYPLGDNLFETLVAGIPSPTFGADLAGEDVAPWETTEHHDPLDVPPDPTWPARLLVGQSRHALLLTPNESRTAVSGCRLTWAWKIKHPPLRDPYTIQERDDKGNWTPRRASTSRALWREVDALLADREIRKRPAILTSATRLPDSLVDRLRVRAVGFDQDRQATNVGWHTAVTPPIVRYLDEFDPVRAVGAETLTTAAEEVAEVMIKELRRAFRALGTGQAGKTDRKTVSPWIEPAQRRFWPDAEILFWRRLVDADFTEPHRAFQNVVLEAIREATSHVDHHPAVAREVSKTRQAVTAFINRKNPRKEKPRGK